MIYLENNKFNNTMKYIFLFLLGGAVYYGIEILWRGYSHPTMFGLGGVVFIFCGLQNEILDWNYPFWRQVARGWLFAIASEFVTGCIVNICLGWKVWDYSGMPLNIMGQVCVPYMILFIPVIMFAIVLDDYVRWIVFGEEKPRYNFKFQ